MAEACCTCAALLNSIPPTYDEKTEKIAGYERRVECCNRAICARCITDNPRFGTYCPFCQVSIVPTSLPQGLRDPPSYSPPGPQAPTEVDEELPPYSAHNPLPTSEGKAKTAPEDDAPDVLHFVDPKDSVASLSLSYGVPASVLRRVNGLYADHLLAARRTVLIPGEYYKGGVSLSPRPVDGEEEEIRKGKVRRFMTTCKVAEYDVALLYLQQSNYDLERAIDIFQADEKWEKEHPLEAAKKGKAKAAQAPPKRRWLFGGSGGGLTGQLS
ncbi:hypothetical protein M011DRAFT_465452 [Sporormia fimetaria CBS 119925]|uniref:LysM domain-containing protein n=1 Tax=Sporormia fimetaria CBS 119925 TaxID=1340428 RepID=A0A6A6VIZ7_9PLEO|nr:hypothetical protein M011DRAFT_465452 [Sporormia fimetaria CBS 119925]